VLTLKLGVLVKDVLGVGFTDGLVGLLGLGFGFTGLLGLNDVLDVGLTDGLVGLLGLLIGLLGFTDVLVLGLNDVLGTVLALGNKLTLVDELVLGVGLGDGLVLLENGCIVLIGVTVVDGLGDGLVDGLGDVVGHHGTIPGNGHAGGGGQVLGKVPT